MQKVKMGLFLSFFGFRPKKFLKKKQADLRRPRLYYIILYYIILYYIILYYIILYYIILYYIILYYIILYYNIFISCVSYKINQKAKRSKQTPKIFTFCKAKISRGAKVCDI